MPTRREFLKKVGTAAAASAVLGSGYLLADTQPDYPVEEKPEVLSLDHTVGDDELFKKLAVFKGDDPAKIVEDAILALGGIGIFVSNGDKVVIKPNIGWDRTPEQAANTNPQMVGKVAEMCLAAGAADVTVIDVTCNDPRRTYLRSGISEATEKAGASVVIPAHEDYITADLGGDLLTGWPVLRKIVECDKLINMPITKHHGLSRATLGMKNLYGIIGGMRRQLHQDIHQSIVDLASFAKPTLVIADCYRVLMRNGPQGGSLGDVKECKTVVAGIDQVAVDSYASQFLDIKPSSLRFLSLGEESGLGVVDCSSKAILTNS